jgi:hypothetical protein
MVKTLPGPDEPRDSFQEGVPSDPKMFFEVRIGAAQQDSIKDRAANFKKLHLLLANNFRTIILEVRFLLPALLTYETMEVIKGARYVKLLYELENVIYFPELKIGFKPIANFVDFLGAAVLIDTRAYLVDRIPSIRALNRDQIESLGLLLRKLKGLFDAYDLLITEHNSIGELRKAERKRKASEAQPE